MAACLVHGTQGSVELSEPIRGAALVGAALFWGPEISVGGCRIKGESGCPWSITLPGEATRTGLGAREAAQILDRWLLSLR